MKKVSLAIMIAVFLWVVDLGLSSNFLFMLSLPSSLIVHKIFASLPGAGSDGILILGYPGEPWWTMGMIFAGASFFYCVILLISRNSHKPWYEKTARILKDKLVNKNSLPVMLATLFWFAMSMTGNYLYGLSNIRNSFKIKEQPGPVLENLYTCAPFLIFALNALILVFHRRTPRAFVIALASLQIIAAIIIFWNILALYNA